MQSCDFWNNFYAISDKSIHSNRPFNLNDTLQIKFGCHSSTNVSGKICLFQRFITEKPTNQKSFKVSQNGYDLPICIDYAKDGKWVKMTEENHLTGLNFVRLTFSSIKKSEAVIIIQETELFGEKDTLIISINPNDVMIEGTFLDTPPLLMEGTFSRITGIGF